MYVASVQVTDRAFYCEACESVRFAKVQRLIVRKINDVWHVQFKRRCSGHAPVVAYKRLNMVRKCGVEIIGWMTLHQWNYLIDYPCYGNNAA